MWGVRRAAALTVAMCCAAVAGACSGSRDDNGDAAAPTLAEVLDATRAGESAAVSGTRTVGGTEFSLAGVFRAEPPAARLRVDVSVGDRTERLEVRVVDRAVYLERAEVSGTVLDEVGADGSDLLARSLVRRAGEARWLRRPARARVALDPSLAGPFALLETLVDARTVFDPPVRDGDGYRFDADAARIGLLPPRELHLWVDGRARLTRVRAEAEATVLDYRITGYAVAVDVAAPPAGEVTESGTATGTAVEPAGDWLAVIEGQDAGVTWSLERAPATNGGTCWRFSSTPRLVDVDVACASPPAEPGTPAEFAVEFPFAGHGTGPVDVVVAVGTVEVTDARFAFVDGTTAPAVASRFSEGTGAVVWIGPAVPPVVAATLTTAAGVELSCGPGRIITAADAQAMTDEELAEERTYPWACTS